MLRQLVYLLRQRRLFSLCEKPLDLLKDAGIRNAGIKNQELLQSRREVSNRGSTFMKLFDIIKEERKYEECPIQPSYQQNSK